METLARLAGLGLALLVLGVAFVPDAEAAILKRMHSGTTTVNDSTTATTVTLELPDASKAFVVCHATTTVEFFNRRVTCDLANNQLSIKPDVAPGANVMTVAWYVAEFESGVSVQRGVASFASNGLSPSTAPSLTAVDCTKSFVVLSGERTNGGDDERLDGRTTFRAVLGSGASPCTSGTTTSLELTRLEQGNAAAVAWQVVTMEGATVQRGVLCIGASGTCAGSNGATNTATLGTAVDTTKAFLLVTRRAGTATAGIDPLYDVRGDFSAAGTSVTGLTFTRGLSSTTANQHVDIAWEVVALGDGSIVQRPGAPTTVAAGTGLIGSPATATISSVDRTTALVVLSTSGPNRVDDRLLPVDAIRATFTNDTTVAFERGDDARDATVSWFVVSFYRCENSRLCNVGAAAGAGQATVHWSPIYNVLCTSPSTCHALVLRDTASITAAPVNGTAYTVGQTIGTATVVHNGSGATAAQSFTNTGLTNGTKYFYKVFPKTAATTYVNLANSISETSATPQTGAQAWSYTATGGATLNPPISNGGNGRVFVASSGRKIIVLDTASGTEVATPVATNAAVQGYLSWFPVSAGGEGVVGGDQSGFLTSVDALTGARNWTVKLNADNLQAPVSVQVRDPRAASAAFQAKYAAEVFYASTRNTSQTVNRVIAVNATNGSVLWTFTGTPAMDRVLGQPFVDYSRDRLWVSSGDGAFGGQRSLWVLDTVNDGALAQTFSIGKLVTGPTLSFDLSTVYIGADDGTLYALNAETLAVKWSSTVAFGTAFKGFVWEDFFATGRLYFVTTNGGVWCVQDDGASASLCADWAVNPRVPVAAGTVAQPLVGDLSMWVGGSDGVIYQMSLTSGAIETTFSLAPGTTLGDIATEDLNQLYLGSSAGTIYRVDLTAGSLP